jgi:hypothetical protein
VSRMCCARCLLVHDPPWVHVGERGLCPACVERQEDGGAGGVIESDIVAMLARLSRGGELPAMIVCNGSRAATLALALAVRRYRLRPVVLILDHGMLMEGALPNVERAARALGLEIHHHREPALRSRFAAALRWERHVPLCTLCTRWMRSRAAAVAQARGARLVLWGGSEPLPLCTGDGQSAWEQRERPYARLWSAQVSAFTKTNPLPSFAAPRTAPLHERLLGRSPPEQLCLHPFGGSDQDAREEALLDGLGWEEPGLSYPRGAGSDCLLNLVSAERCMAEHGVTHYHLGLSRRVRAGEVSLDAARESVAVDFGASPYRQALAGALRRLEDAGGPG